ncbi:9982_t:CDS:1, partial [Gigaspora margarita]
LKDLNIFYMLLATTSEYKTTLITVLPEDCNYTLNKAYPLTIENIIPTISVIFIRLQSEFCKS